MIYDPSMGLSPTVAHIRRSIIYSGLWILS